jgi:hypothetical protein
MFTSHTIQEKGTDLTMYTWFCRDTWQISCLHGRARRPTMAYEASLISDKNRWWKIANNVSGKVGALRANGVFSARSLDTIFGASGKGVTVNIICKFYAKASTGESQPLKGTVPQRIVLELERASMLMWTSRCLSASRGRRRRRRIRL